jgi:hypothetical protein
MNQPAVETINDYVSTAELTEDDRHRLFANGRRRLALDCLAGETPPTELADLAAEIATREDGIDPDDRETLHRVKIELHHVHLPKMDDFGVVDYDTDARRLTR